MMKTIEIKVEGMSCKNCSDKIDKALNEMKGIKEAKTILADDLVKVTFDPNHASEKLIKNKIRETGYSIKGETQTAGKNSETKKTIFQGILYGLIPHIGCIGFLIASILGVTFAAELFKPLLKNSMFFYGLIGLSLVFATISSAFYLKKNELLSVKGIKKKKGYLAALYGTTIGVSLLFLFVIFPMLTSASFGSDQLSSSPQLVSQNNLTGTNSLTIQNNSLQSITIEVQIPCAGHTPLIVSELKKIAGVTSISSPSWNTFKVNFDPKKTTAQKILGAEIFKDYPATLKE
ncbi:MAG: heavy-metal-associated domain-containing protein [archaeon]